MVSFPGVISRESWPKTSSLPAETGYLQWRNRWYWVIRLCAGMHAGHKNVQMSMRVKVLPEAHTHAPCAHMTCRYEGVYMRVFVNLGRCMHVLGIHMCIHTCAFHMCMHVCMPTHASVCLSHRMSFSQLLNSKDMLFNPLCSKYTFLTNSIFK